MTLEAPRRRRDDSNECTEPRLVLRDRTEDFSSESVLRDLESGVFQRIECGEPPRLFVDEIESSTELCAQFGGSPDEFPNAEQLVRLKRALEIRIDEVEPSAVVTMTRRKTRVKLVALAFVLPALAAAVGGYDLAGSRRGRRRLSFPTRKHRS
jgi:hypothetical protein